MSASPKRRRSRKPRFGENERHGQWPDGFVFRHDPALLVPEEQAREIAASLGVEDDSEYVAAVLAAIRRFHGRETAMAELPTGDHRARDIETLKALERAMKGLNLNVLNALDLHGVDLSCDGAHVAEVARLASEDIKQARPRPKNGRKSLDSRAVLFRELAEIYTAATGRPAKICTASGATDTEGQPIGRFFRFIRAAVAPVPALAGLGNHALAKAVTRATRTNKR